MPTLKTGQDILELPNFVQIKNSEVNHYTNDTMIDIITKGFCECYPLRNFKNGGFQSANLLQIPLHNIQFIEIP